MVRAKFKVDSIEHTIWNHSPKLDDKGAHMKDAATGQWLYNKQDMATVKMSPVSANNNPDHENSKFWAASPSGSLMLGTVNMAAVAQLKVGEEYYVDLTHVPGAV